MKKIIFTALLALAYFFALGELIAHAQYSVPLNATSSASSIINPKWGGTVIYPAIQAPYFTASSTSATSTFPIASFSYPTFATTTQITSLNATCWGDSLTYASGYISYCAQLPAYFPSYPIQATNQGYPGYTSAQILQKFLTHPELWPQYTIIWSGRNDNLAGGDAATLANIAAMVAKLPSPKHFLVLSVINDLNQESTTTGYAQIVGLNNDLKAAYPNNYFDIREYLVQQYNPSIPQDVYDYTWDTPPSSLRATGDPLHLNSAGYAFVAQQVAAYIQANTSYAPMPVNFADLPAAIFSTTNIISSSSEQSFFWGGAGNASSSGMRNVGGGNGSMGNITSGTDNTTNGVGELALITTQTNDVVCGGSYAAQSTTISQITACGGAAAYHGGGAAGSYYGYNNAYMAGSSATGGTNYGSQGGYYNVSGIYQTGFGYSNCLYALGNYDSCFGPYSGSSFLSSSSGYPIFTQNFTNGTGDMFQGMYSGVASTTATYNYNSTFGFGAETGCDTLTTAFPCIILGASSTTAYFAHVGIGTTTPWNVLSVAGAGWFDGGVTATNLSATGTLTVSGNASIGTTSQNVTGLTMGKSNNIKLYGGTIQLSTGAGVGTGSIGASGDGSAFQLNTDNLIPGTDNAQTLGLSSFRWNAILAGTGNSTFAGKVGIGTTTPWAQLSVEGQSTLGNLATAGSFNATTTATSTFTGGISAAQVCLVSSPTICLGAAGSSSVGPIGVIQASNGSGGFEATGTPTFTAGNYIATTTTASTFPFVNVTTGFQVGTTSAAGVSPGNNPVVYIQSAAGNAVPVFTINRTTNTFANNLATTYARGALVVTGSLFANSVSFAGDNNSMDFQCGNQNGTVSGNCNINPYGGRLTVGTSTGSLSDSSEVDFQNDDNKTNILCLKQNFSAANACPFVFTDSLREGIGTSSPGFEFSVASSTSPNTNTFSVDSSGNQYGGGGTPSVSCASTCTLDANAHDSSGIIYLSGVQTSVTLTFYTPKPWPPHCLVSDNVTSGTYDASSTPTTLVFQTAVSIGTGSLSYVCQQ